MTPEEISQIPVAILIPTYNRIGTLEKTIQSALGQTHPNVRVYVSDNASTDGTEALCESFKAYPNFNYRRLDKNYGGYQNFMGLQEWCSERWYIILGDDDYIDDDFVEKCLHFALTNKCNTVVGTTISYTYGKKTLRDSPYYLGDEDPLLRLFCFHQTPNTNSIFNGLRSNPDALLFHGIPGSDWIDSYTNIYRGKVAAIGETHLHREMTKWLEPKVISETESYKGTLRACGYTEAMLPEYETRYLLAEIVYRFYRVIHLTCPKEQARAFLHLIFCMEWWRVHPEQGSQLPNMVQFIGDIILSAKREDAKVLPRFKDLSMFMWDWRKDAKVDSYNVDFAVFSQGQPDARVTIWHEMLRKSHQVLNGKPVDGVFNATYVRAAADALRLKGPQPVAASPAQH